VTSEGRLESGGIKARILKLKRLNEIPIDRYIYLIPAYGSQKVQNLPIRETRVLPMSYIWAKENFLISTSFLMVYSAEVSGMIGQPQEKILW